MFARQPSFWTTAAPEWLAAIGTLALAFVAAFQEWLKKIIFRPQLYLSARQGPPDCQKTSWTGNVPVYYLRLAVTNRGNAEARDVQVYVASVQRAMNGRFQSVDRFSPMNLVWALTRKPTLPILLADMPPRLCDFAHITYPAHKSKVSEDLVGVPPSDPVLALDLEVQPNTQGHLLEPGFNYRIFLKLVASNHPPRDYLLDVNFAKGRWFEDELLMFSEGIAMQLTETSHRAEHGNDVAQLSERIKELGDKSTQILIFLSFAMVVAATLRTSTTDARCIYAFGRVIHWWLRAVVPVLICILPLKEFRWKSLSWYRFVRGLKVVLLWIAIVLIIIGVATLAWSLG